MFKQLVFGVDTINAITLCAIVGLIFDPHPGFSSAIGYLVLAGFGSYLPNLDLLIFLPFRKVFGWESHWNVGHHPIVVLPLASILVLKLAQTIGIGDPVHAAGLMFFCVLAHFVHDSTEEFGFPWLSPFNKDMFITFFYGWPRIVSSELFHEHERKLNESSKVASIGEKLAKLSEPTTIGHVLVWFIAVALFCWWVAF